MRVLPGAGLSCDRDALQGIGAGADTGVAGNENDARSRERELLALGDRLAGGFLDADDVASGDLQLFPAGADDGVHKERA